MMAPARHLTNTAAVLGALAMVGSLVVSVASTASAEIPITTVTVDTGVINVAIPDSPAAGIESGLVVAESGRVADVVVGIRIDHTFGPDVDLTLTSPSGTTLDISSDNGANGAGYGTAANCSSPAGLTVLDDAAAASVTTGGVGLPGSYSPEEPFYLFGGEEAAGTWTIGVTDDDQLAFGTLICWSLTVDVTPEAEPIDPCDSIAFDGNDIDGVRHIWVVNSDGTGRTAISAVGPGPVSTSAFAADWSPDGARIAWDGINDAAGRQIWVANADGTDRTIISDVSAGVDPTANSQPDWSPDGTRIAWYGRDGAGVSQILAANADGTDRTIISDVSSGTDPTGNNEPKWSPDGSKIAWDGVDPDSGVRQIYVSNADGTDRMIISDVGTGTDPIGNDEPVWSPDGSKIAWDGTYGLTSLIFVAAVDGTGRLEISGVAPGPDLTENNNVAWSPDGTQLAWNAVADLRRDVYVADVDGTNRAAVSAVAPDPSPSGGNDPMWSPDGDRLVWDGSGIVVANADGSEREVEISRVEVGFDPSSNDPVWRKSFGKGPCTTPECPTDATPFTDVPDSSFAYLDVKCIYGLEITTGTSLTTYDPNGLVTREQMAAFLARLWRSLGHVCPAGTTPFTDVAATSFAYDDITCIYLLGITTGTSLTTYDPNGLVTREQMAAFLARLWRKC